MFHLPLVFFCSLSLAQAGEHSIKTEIEELVPLSKEAEVIAKGFLPGLDPCESYELSFPDDLNSSLTSRLPQNLDVPLIERVSAELGSANAFSKYYIPNPTIRRYQLQKTFERLAEFMKAKHIDTIPLKIYGDANRHFTSGQ